MNTLQKLAKVKVFADELGLKSDFYTPIVLVIVPHDEEETQQRTGSGQELPLADREEGRQGGDWQGEGQGPGKDAGGSQ